MSQGIFRPRQQVQRVTPNAGNRYYIAGGHGINRPVKPGAVVPPPPPPPPVPQEPTP